MKGSLTLNAKPEELKIIFMGGESGAPKAYVNGQRTENQKTLTLGDGNTPAFAVPCAVALTDGTFLADARVLAGNAISAATSVGTQLAAVGASKITIRPETNFSMAVTVEIEKLVSATDAKPAR